MLKICPNLHNKQVAKEFGELEHLFGDAAYLLWSKNNGYSIDKAPNGADSILFGELLNVTKGDRAQALMLKAKVYSKEFFNWFGDWTSEDKTNVSKIVDKNGEPQIQYHYDKYQYSNFEDKKRKLNTDRIYFSPKRGKWSHFAGPIEHAVYLNIKSPKYGDIEINSFGEIGKDNDGLVLSPQFYDYIDNLKQAPSNIWEEYIITDNSQVKSVFNNGEFVNPGDIYASMSVDKSKEVEDYLSPYISNGRYLNIHSKEKAHEIAQKLKSIDDRYSIKYNNEKRAWYYHFQNRGVKSIMDILEPNSNKVNTEKLMQYLDKALPKKNGVMQVLREIISQSTEKNGLQVKFSYNLPYGVAARYNRNTHTIEINPNASFSNESNLKDTIAQGFLHELIHACTVETLHYDSKLRKEAQELLDYIRKSLGEEAKDYGLTDIYEMLAELSNPKFVEKLSNLPSIKKQNIWYKIYNFFNNVIRKLIGNKLGTAYSDAIEIMIKAAMPDSVGIQKDYIEDQRSDDYNVTTGTDLHSKIVDQYTKLFNTYKHMQNLTPARERIKDKLWSTLQNLRAKDMHQTLEICLNQAMEQCGSIIKAPNGRIIDAPKNTMLGYLQDKAKHNFAGVSPQDIADMYNNTISFYNDLTEQIYDQVDTFTDQEKEALDKLTVSLKDINVLWKKAANYVSDQIIDQLVDQFLPDRGDKDAIKEVAKDWLHKNEMYGDLNAILSRIFNFSRQNSPVIKQAFQLIQTADVKTRQESSKVAVKLAKSYKRASNILKDLTPGNSVNTVLMETFKDGDLKGQKTGNFRSAVNRGQYKHEKEQFIAKLKQQWLDQKGFCYMEDKITGELYKSDDMSSVTEQVWDNGKMPDYYEYNLRIQNWICSHSNRRHTYQYYQAMMSQPYDPKTKTGHGLSPKTMHLLNNTKQQINYILQKCTDEDTGLAHPENLSPDDKKKLEMWNQNLQDLSNPFDEYGNLKTGEEYTTAIELQAWNNWVQERTDYKTDFDLFDRECYQMQQDVYDGKKTQQQYNDFVDANSEWNINPQYIDYYFNDVAQAITVSRMFQNSIKRLVKTKNGFKKNFYDVILSDNGDGTVSIPDMWFVSRHADEQNNMQSKDSAIDPEDFDKAFKMTDVLYTDLNGNYLDDGGNVIKPGQRYNGRLITWFDYILDAYTNAIINGSLQSITLLDQTQIDTSIFNGDRNAIRNWITDNILTYDRIWKDKHGVMHQKKVPLSILQQMVPTQDSIVINGIQVPSQRYVPKGRFTEKQQKSGYGFGDEIYNQDFNVKDFNGEQPKFELYGDQEFVDLIQKGGALAEYYKDLLDTMKQYWKVYGMDPTINRYKLPQIEGTQGMKNSRILENGVIDNMKNRIKNITSVTSDDSDMRDENDFVKRNGRWVLDSVPRRFVNDMEDPQNISSDLAFSVTAFAEAALNYKHKQEIQPILQTIGYALDEARGIDYKANGENQNAVYKRMLEKLLYEMKDNSKTPFTKGKQSIFINKFMKKFQSAAAVQMLALNLSSIRTGFHDAMFTLPHEAARGDSYNFTSLVKAAFKGFPDLFKAVANVGNPIPNCKAVAMMRKDGLVLDLKESTQNIYKHRIRRGLQSLLMGGYTMCDYAVTMLLQRATYEHKHFYDDSVYNLGIDSGYYTNHQFQRFFKDHGKTEKDGHYAWRNSGKTMWDAYKFENGVAVPKYGEDKYLESSASKISSEIQQRAALINGNNPKNDYNYYSSNVLYRLVFLMRNFMIRKAEHFFAGMTPENIVRTPVEQTDTEIRGSHVYGKRRTGFKKLTDEEKLRAGAINYSTGEFEPCIIPNLYRGAKQTVKNILNVLRSMPEAKWSDVLHKYNPSEIKALREAAMFMLIQASLQLTYMPLHNYVVNNVLPNKPYSYEEAVPSIKNYIETKQFALDLDLMEFRLMESRLSGINPFSTIDLIQSATSANGALDDWRWAAGIIPDYLGWSNHTPDDVMTNASKYQWYTRKQAALFKATGFLDNLHSSLSFMGQAKSLQWYQGTYGSMFRAMGYDLSSGTTNSKMINDIYKIIGIDLSDYIGDTQGAPIKKNSIKIDPEVKQEMDEAKEQLEEMKNDPQIQQDLNDAKQELEEMKQEMQQENGE